MTAADSLLILMRHEPAAPAEAPPDPNIVDWNMYLGPAAWRPFNAKLLDGFNGLLPEISVDLGKGRLPS